jgi:hypothetical protein
MLALASICAALLRMCCTRRKNTRAATVHFSQKKLQWQDAWNLFKDARLSLYDIAFGCSAILRSVMCATRCFCHVKCTEAPEFPAEVVNASKEFVRGRASGMTVCDLASCLGGLLGSGAGRGVILLFTMYKLDYPGMPLLQAGSSVLECRRNNLMFWHASACQIGLQAACWLD